MINDFRTLLDDTQDETHCVALYRGMRDCMKHMSCNTTSISDEQLHAIEIFIYHCIVVEVERLEGEHISQICRCTGNQIWHRGDRQNNWVWVEPPLGMCYATLSGCLPLQLQQLFKIKLLNEDGCFVEYYLALALTTICVNLANLNPISEFVPV